MAYRIQEEEEELIQKNRDYKCKLEMLKDDKEKETLWVFIKFKFKFY